MREGDDMIEIKYMLVATILGWIGLIISNMVLVGIMLSAPKRDRLIAIILCGIMLTLIWTLALTILKIIVWVV